MNKFVVYTAIYGDKDIVRERQYKIPNTDYIMFTDDHKLTSNIWNIKYVPKEIGCTVRDAKRFKVLPHMWVSGYEKSIWIDGNMEIKSDFTDLLKSSFDWLVFGHGRNCVYDEGDTCIVRKKDNSDVIKKHIDRYKKEGYPKENGLWSSGVLVRNHNDTDMIKMNEMWWHEIQNGSRRDQISAPYVAWKCGLLPEYIDGLSGHNALNKSKRVELLAHKR